eukprot:scaffold10861_cov180-Amphora_coffeaeformis.AAC.49
MQLKAETYKSESKDACPLQQVGQKKLSTDETNKGLLALKDPSRISLGIRMLPCHPPWDTRLDVVVKVLEVAPRGSRSPPYSLESPSMRWTESSRT